MHYILNGCVLSACAAVFFCCLSEKMMSEIINDRRRETGRGKFASAGK
jgi:hypothetical protein